MNVLVVGTVSPPGGQPAHVLGTIAADCVANGDEVEVVSPDLRSASHRHARLSGLWLPIQLARGVRRFDALILRIEPNVPLKPETGRFSRAATLMALAGVLRLYKNVTLRLDSPVPLPGGLGGRSIRPLWTHADVIVVSNEEDARNLKNVPGVDSGRVRVEEAPALEASAHFDSWSIDPAGNVREDVLMLVKERANRDRQAMRAHSSIVGGSSLSLGGDSFDDARVPAPSIIAFSRFGLARVKGRVKRLVESRAS